MQRWTAVAAAAAVFAASSLMGYALSAAGPAGPAAVSQERSDVWYQQTRACVDEPEMNRTEECLYRMMTAAVDAHDLANLNAGLARQVKQDPSFFSVCHGPGHRAGQYAYQSGQGIGELLSQLSDPVCQYGIGHGVIDGMADSGPTEDDFRELARVCHQYWNGPGKQADPAYVFCLDGSGHGAYWSTRDPVKAARLCDLHLTSTAKQECVGGVMMEMYEPAGFKDRGPADYQLEKAGRDLPQVCQDIAQLGVQELAAGCARGSGYVFTRPAWASFTGLPERPDSRDLLAVAQEWARNAGQCLLLGQSVRDCQDMAEYQMPWPLRANGWQDRACGMLEDKSRVEVCAKVRVTIT